jgi:hypothetical protein
VNGNPVNNIDPGGLQTWPGDAGPSSPRPTIPGPFDIFHPGTQVNNTFVQSVNQIIDKVKDFCLPDELSCSPPQGTKCYVGPDTSHGHGGLSSHYHIFQMFKFSGRCQWKYLGGKVGKGVLEIPPIGMAACSNYPGFQGR